MSTEEKLERIGDFMIGKTIFEEPEKKWLACDYYDVAPIMANHELLPVFYDSTLDGLLDQVMEFSKL
jgi:myo-inositol catabolism protein IolC